MKSSLYLSSRNKDITFLYNFGGFFISVKYFLIQMIDYGLIDKYYPSYPNTISLVLISKPTDGEFYNFNAKCGLKIWWNKNENLNYLT